MLHIYITCNMDWQAGIYIYNIYIYIYIETCPCMHAIYIYVYNISIHIQHITLDWQAGAGEMYEGIIVNDIRDRRTGKYISTHTQTHKYISISTTSATGAQASI